MSQLCLIFPAARKTDPKTSHEAAIKARAIAPSHRNRIMHALKSGPLTIYGIAQATGLDHVSIARRMKELERLGLAATTGVIMDGCRQWAAL
jgi:predicted transcriptional regulator